MNPTKELYTLLMETMLLLDDGDNNFFQNFNLSEVRYHTLKHTAQTPGLSLSELSQKLLCTKGNATRIVKSMEADGYLRREVNTDDNRALQLYLTEAGQTLLQEISNAYDAFNKLRFEQLATDEQTNLRQGLTHLNAHLHTMLHHNA